MTKTRTALLGSMIGVMWTAATILAATFSIVRITDNAGCSRTPSISGSGGRVAFNSEGDLTGGNADGNFEVFLWDRKTDAITQITDTAGDDNDDGLITKGGNRIVFGSTHDLVSGSNVDGNREIFVFDEKKGFGQITDTTGGNTRGAAINNNASKIVFLSPHDFTGDNADGNEEIFLWDKKKGFTQISDTTGAAFFAEDLAVNKNGSRIAFSSSHDLVSGENADGSQEIFLFEKTTGFRQITDGDGCLSQTPAMTQSGNRLAFMSSCDLVGDNADGSFEIFLFDAAAGLTQITDTAAANFSFSPSFDARGNRLVFLSNADLVPGGNTGGNIQVFVFDRKPGAFSQLTNGDSTNQTAGGPKLSNNGKRIVFEYNNELTPMSNADNEGEIYFAEQD